MNIKRPGKLLIFFISFFILLLTNSCREKDSWEDYMLHENINRIKAVATLPSGEIIVIGYVIRDDENGPSIVIVKYLENGLIDPDFGEEGVVFTDRQLSSFGSLICQVAISNEGSIIFTASNTPESGEPESFIARYSADGNIDNSFGNMGVKKYTSVAVYSLGLMDNNNILISGTKSFETSHKKFFVSKLDETGQEIAEFGDDGTASFDFNPYNSNCVYQKVLNDGKILLLGNTEESQNIVPMLRLHPDGNLDTTFSSDGKLLADMGYDIDGNICINNTGDDKYLLLSIIDYDDLLFARINQNGSLDNEFGQEGIAVNMCCPDNPVSARSVFVRGNEGFIVLGRESKRVVLADVLPNGQLNGAFGENGIVSYNYDDFNSVRKLSVIESYEKIIVTGELDVYYNYGLDQDTDFFIMRFNEDGTIDSSFGDEGVVISDIR